MLKIFRITGGPFVWRLTCLEAILLLKGIHPSVCFCHIGSYSYRMANNGSRAFLNRSLLFDNISNISKKQNQKLKGIKEFVGFTGFFRRCLDA